MSANIDMYIYHQQQ